MNFGEYVVLLILLAYYEKISYNINKFLNSLWISCMICNKSEYYSAFVVIVLSLCCMSAIGQDTKSNSSKTATHAKKDVPQRSKSVVSATKNDSPKSKSGVTTAKTASRTVKSDAPISKTASQTSKYGTNTSKFETSAAKSTAFPSHHSRISKLSEDNAPDVDSDVSNRDYLQRSSHSRRLLEDPDDIPPTPTHKSYHSGSHKNSAGAHHPTLHSYGRRMSSMKQRRLDRMSKHIGSRPLGYSHTN